MSECRRVSCCDSASGEEFSPFIFSLVDGGSYTNAETTFVIPCPVGYDCTADTVTVVLPPGTVKFNPTVLNPNPPPSGSGDPRNPAAGTYTFNCGDEELTVTTDGSGFTQAQLDEIINFLAQCQATKDGNVILEPVPVLTPSGDPGLRLWNTEQTCTVNCTVGEGSATATVPANTNSTIVAQSATPLAKYLAQQSLNTAAYNEACAEATAELVCSCGEYACTLSASIAATDPVCCVYADNADLVFGCPDDFGFIEVIDPATMTVSGTITFDVTHRAFTIGYHPGSGKIYVVTQPIGGDAWLRIINPLTQAIESTTLLLAGGGNPGKFSADEVNERMYCLIYSPFNVFSIDANTGAITLVDNTGAGTGGGMAYAPVANILFVSEDTELRAYDADGFALMTVLTTVNFPNSLAFCPDTNELFSEDFLASQILVWDVQASLSTTTTAPFTAPDFNANETVFITDDTGMYVGRNFLINDVEWQLVSIDNPGEITVKNLLVTPGTIIGAGATVAWVGTENSDTITPGGIANGLQYDDKHRKIVSAFNPTGGATTNTHILVVEPEDHSISCNFEIGTQILTAQAAAFCANCSTVVADAGGIFTPADRYRVIT